MMVSNFGSDFLHLNTGNGTMPLNPRPKRPPYVVFFVLYEFCVVLNFLYLIFLRVVCALYDVLYCIVFI